MLSLGIARTSSALLSLNRIFDHLPLNMLDEDKLKSLFLHLLRAAIWEDKVDTSLFPLSESEWQWIYVTAVRQTMESVLLDAVLSLPEDCQPSSALQKAWTTAVVAQERAYLEQLRTLNYIYARFLSSGITPVVVKGVSLSVCYPRPNHRYASDIDLFYGTITQKDEADKTIEGWGIPVERKLQDESICMVGQVVVENHGRLFLDHNPLVGPSTRKRLDDALSSPNAYCRKDVSGSEITTLNPTLTLLLLVCHSYRHVITSGIGLRQLTDIALFLNKEHNNIQWDTYISWAKDWKMMDWTRCLLTTLRKYLGLSPALSPLDAGSEKDADVLMNEVWLSANFGQTDTRYVGQEAEKNSKRTTLRRLLHYYRLFAHHSYGEATGSLMKLIHQRLKEKLSGKSIE